MRGERRQVDRMVFSGYASWVQKEMSLFGGVLCWWELKHDREGWRIIYDHEPFDGDTVWILPKNWVVL